MAVRKHAPSALPLPAFYLSQLIGGDVRDPLGEKVGVLKDLVVRLDPAEPHDRVMGLVARFGRRTVFIKWDHVAALDTHAVVLSSTRVNLQPFERREGEMLLGRDVLDKQ